ncbi:hypothetical protein DH2020_036803 [Rehmannia glutinosa]|uniref:ARID domain-containing protein n=1 Tax=Rehmannia glutinosa TaxID=99300 RepID=A0ABR0V4U2_REHGL
MEDNNEAVHDALGGSGGTTAAPDEQQTQHVESNEFHEFKDMEAENEIEHKNGEKSVESAPGEHLSVIANVEGLGDSQVFQVKKKSPPSTDANAKELCSESVALTRTLTEVQAESEKGEEELKDEVPEVLSSADNGFREEDLENGSTTTGDIQKEGMEGNVNEVEVVANNGKEEPNGVLKETDVQPADEMEELKIEPDIKTPSKSFLLDANDVTGDESGTEEEQAAFMKELDTFHRERCLDFKPPKFYQEPLNCLKLWRAVIRLGGYEQALLEYEKYKMRSGELPFTDASLSDPASGNQVDLIHPSGSGRARRDAAARAMQGWHSQRLLGNGEVGDPIIKDKNPISTPKREKQLRNIGKIHCLNVMDRLEIMVVDVGVPADWVKVNVQRMVRVQSDPAGRLVISGQPEQQDNPWGVTPFKKVNLCYL